MKTADAMKAIQGQVKKGKDVFHIEDLRILLPEKNERNFRATTGRLMKLGFLQRVSPKVFFCPMAETASDGYLLERIACVLRRGEFCYLSLESVLSAHSIISQQLLDTITVMTTGKSGRYIVDGVGVVDFTQTHKNLANFIHNIDFSCGFLPRANIKQAYADLKRVKRNLHLVIQEDLEELMHEQG
ncbi:type IV toxin-antitoxin system AbiEi family antitoxin [Jhaorihella thermophila]|uniref:type IV toxin-antitoxin system AbiEi family antitoxin n=1 Tax=Jhaorihella thermophila TaxID=488547 RepID=UPI000CDE8E75|nr:hypothetical protein [Jhaorihella thermophila]